MIFRRFFWVGVEKYVQKFHNLFFTNSFNKTHAFDLTFLCSIVVILKYFFVVNRVYTFFRLYLRKNIELKKFGEFRINTEV